MRDLLYAWRSVRATPRLALAAAACAALGLGAAIFMTALVNAVLFSSPEVPEADRLVRIWTSSTATRETADVSYQEYVDVAARVGTLEAVAAVARTRLALRTGAGTERLRGESVTRDYFALSGLHPALGRVFEPGEYEADGSRVVIISHDLWQRRFGGRPDVLGEPFVSRPTTGAGAEAVRTIVGVMPAGTVGTVDPDVSDFWMPMAHFEPAGLLDDRLVRNVWVLGRLRPGASLAAFSAEVAALADDLAQEHPDAYDRVTLTAEPFGESWRARFRLSLFTMAAAAGLLLLIACTNVATLLLVRLAQRQDELRIRAALGAPPGRLMRQLLAESVFVGVAGGASGLLLAAVAIRLVRAAALIDLPPYAEVTFAPRTALAGVTLIVLTSLGAGVLPARFGARARGTLASRELDGRHSLGRRQRRWGRRLVAAQVAFTCVLLVGAALLARTHANLTGGDLGFRQDHLLRLALSPDPAVYPDAASRVALADAIRTTLDAYPGVRRAAVLGGVLPPWYDTVADVEITPEVRLRDVGRHAIGPGFLDVMDLRIVDGRGLAAADRADGARAALASASLARRAQDATGRSIVGQRLRLTVPGEDATDLVDIVGVVADVTYHGPLNPRPADYDLYVPLERAWTSVLSIAVHTDVDPAALIDPLTRELGRLAATSPQHWISTMEGELSLQYRDARLYASLSGVYGVAALLVAVLGVYSVLAHSVARRQRELGIRIAIGARRAQIVRLVLAEGVRTIALGVAAGLVMSFAAARGLAGLLHGVVPGDPITLLVVAVALFAAGLLACVVPSLRAARVEPLRALRDGRT